MVILHENNIKETYFLPLRDRILVRKCAWSTKFAAQLERAVAVTVLSPKYTGDEIGGAARQVLLPAVVTAQQTKHTGGVTFGWCRCKWVLSSLNKHESQAWSDVSWMVDQSQAGGKRNYLTCLMCADPLGGSRTSHYCGRFCRAATRIRLFCLQCASGLTGQLLVTDWVVVSRI